MGAANRHCQLLHGSSIPSEINNQQSALVNQWLWQQQDEALPSSANHPVANPPPGIFGYPWRGICACIEL